MRYPSTVSAVLAMGVVFGAAGGVRAQAPAESAAGAPGGVPAEIAEMLSIAPPGFEGGSSTLAPGEPPADLGPSAGAAAPRYLFSTLRVITDGASRGCAVNDWNCMSNLCKADLGATAWRGWAGCWRDGAKFICYFECGQARDAF